MTISANQRLVNEAWEHLSLTRTKSVEKGCCSYAGSGCAFSVCIKPELIDLKILDSKNARGFRCGNDASEDDKARRATLKDWALDVDLDFAFEVQQSHDNCINTKGDKFVLEFAQRLESVILDYSFQSPESMTKWLADHEEVQ